MVYPKDASLEELAQLLWHNAHNLVPTTRLPSTVSEFYMARYTCSFTVSLSLENLHECLVDLFTGCHLDVIYDTADYVMAREVPGRVPFAKLVTAEALIDKTSPDREKVRINLVMKNEELPLQFNNHCHQMFDAVKTAIAEHYNWQLVDLVSS